MSRIDLHMDELFDGARTGTLSTLEATRLQAHCAQCAACRAELGWIGDGLHLGAASDADRERGARAVEALLGGAPEAAQTARPSGRVRAATVSRWQAAALVCLGLLMASAGAALYTEVQAWRAREAAATTTAAARSSERASVAARVKAQRRARAAAAHDAAQVEPGAAIMAPAVPSIPLPGVSAPEPRRLQPPSTSNAPASPLDRARSAEALFARANAERTAGALERALAGYEALALAFPETRSALASHISRAELLLRRMHAPAEALVAYRSYLTAAPEGPLAEQARVGVATCAQQLGQDDEDRKAWLELLEQHPGSLHAERAHARLRALSP